MKEILYYVAVLGLCACQDHVDKKNRPAPKVNASHSNKVTYIVDGDTFDITDSVGNVIRVRPIGINADEMRDNAHGKKGLFARQAKEYLAKLIYNKQVRLELDVQKKDKYKRVLAYVFVHDTIFVNAEMVKHGYAVIETEPPNVKYADLFLRLQREARENNRGLWKRD